MSRKGEPGASCPICGRAGTARFRPFCSARCADVDLGRWLSGFYAIPAEPADDDRGAADPGDDREPGEG